MSEWDNLCVPKEVLKGLKDKNFTSPTSIQRHVLPSAIRNKMDIIGAAETGSGKTLAFAIPIVCHLLEQQKSVSNNNDDEDNEEGSPDNKLLEALIITPTRELALQIRDHIKDVTKYTSIKCAAVVGGMSIEKQIRLLKQQPEVVIATPGRLWELIQQKVSHVKCLDSLKFLVIDEVDKMMEKNHFEELEQILTYMQQLELLKKKNMIKDWMKKTAEEHDTVLGEESDEIKKKKLINDWTKQTAKEYDIVLSGDETDDDNNRKAKKDDTKNLKLGAPNFKVKRQNFVFSATLTFMHKKPQRIELKKKKMKEMTLQDRIESLQQKLGMSNKPKIVDLTKGQEMVAHTLEEQRINCGSTEKDIYMYYFLKSRPGRTLMFANSKDSIRRLTSLFRMLHCEPLPLHADMHQKQRLKNLDRFKENANGLLLATDVAARGLDIPDVQYVIHYHVPRTAESYVHRSGRTARSNKEGLSVVLVSPEEDSAFKKILISLKREKDLDSIKIENALFRTVSRTVHLARNVEKEEYQLKKKKMNKDWIKQTAKECDIALSGDETDDSDDGEAKEDVMKRRKLDNLKRELDEMIGTHAKPKSKKKKKRSTKDNAVLSD